MIDHAQVKRDLTMAKAMIADDYVKISVFAEDYRDLLTDCLALRAIVEALAAKPDIVQWDNPNRCVFCGEWTFQHAEGCLQQAARALVGAAEGSAEDGE